MGGWWLVLLFVVLTVTVSIGNECGGGRSLLARIGDVCDSNMVAGCPFGTVQCQSTDSIMCVPNCTITAKMVLDISRLPIQECKCVNGGTMAFGACVCLPLYTGQYCEKEVACEGVDCHGNGRCMGGVCECNFMYGGVGCEIRKDCQSFNTQWNGDRCVCAPFFGGPDCSQCVDGLICLPEEGSVYAFRATIVRDEQLRQELLSTDPPEQYKVAPFVPLPSAQQACQCSPPSSSLSYGGSKSLAAQFVPNDFFASFGGSPEECGMYIPHHFQRHSSEDDEDGLCSMLGFSVFFTVVIVFAFALFLMLYGGCFRRSPPEPRLVLPTTPPVPLRVAPPPPRPPMHPVFDPLPMGGTKYPAFTFGSSDDD